MELRDGIPAKRMAQFNGWKLIIPIDNKKTIY